jgi:hypothetical protein
MTMRQRETGRREAGQRANEPDVTLDCSNNLIGRRQQNAAHHSPRFRHLCLYLICCRSCARHRLQRCAELRFLTSYVFWRRRSTRVALRSLRYLGAAVSTR